MSRERCFGLFGRVIMGTPVEGLADTEAFHKICGMSLNLSDEEIHGLIAYARDKFANESYPFAPALRPIREALVKLDPKPVPQTTRAEEALCAEPSAATEETSVAANRPGASRSPIADWREQGRVLYRLFLSI